MIRELTRRSSGIASMNGFLSEDFLLSNDAARRLYHQFAASQPILDYHCHLSPRDLAENRRFANLFEIWLEETTINGGLCEPTAYRKSTLPATPRPTRNSWPGREPFPTRCAIPSTTGRTSNCSATSASPNCWMKLPLPRSGSAPTPRYRPT